MVEGSCLGGSAEKRLAPELSIGLDIGSVRRRGGFAWCSADQMVSGSDDPSLLAQAMAEALLSGRSVALAVEAPMAVPIPSEGHGSWVDLGRARTGEGNRAWSAGAGAGSLATALPQLTWVLRRVRQLLRSPVSTTTQVHRYLDGAAALLIAEAFVSGDGKPIVVGSASRDHADALAAARRLEQILTDVRAGALLPKEVQCSPHEALNLAAVAAVRAGLEIDHDEIALDVLVAKCWPSTSPV